MSIIIFLAVLFVLILVHEWGHYITAKWTGMRVDEFAIGFPPRLYGVKRGETEYTINALPIGGFVKILGENGDLEGEALSPADKARTFSARPKWAQALVLIAGVTMNVLFAWCLFVVVLMIGMPTAVTEEAATTAAVLTVTNVLPDSPAAVLPVQSTITAISLPDRSLEKLTPSAVSDFIASSEGKEITVTYEDKGVTKTATLVPVAGLITDTPERYAVGVGLVLAEHISFSFGAAVVEATIRTYETLVAITVGLFDLIVGAFTGEADLSQVAGPVGIVGYVGEAASVGITALLVFTAVISLNLAVINLLPVPALDGGRLVFVAIEAVIRRPINPIWASRLNIAGFALLMLLMLAVTYNDIIRLL